MGRDVTEQKAARETLRLTLERLQLALTAGRAGIWEVDLATHALKWDEQMRSIYGLTEEPYLVLTANIFALMGLRQLYFLIGGLLERLVFLSYGLAVLLGFIGIKLVLEAPN